MNMMIRKVWPLFLTSITTYNGHKRTLMLLKLFPLSKFIIRRLSLAPRRSAQGQSGTRLDQIRFDVDAEVAIRCLLGEETNLILAYNLPLCREHISYWNWNQGKALFINCCEFQAPSKEEKHITRTVANDTPSSSAWSKSPNCLIRAETSLGRVCEKECSPAKMLQYEDAEMLPSCSPLLRSSYRPGSLPTLLQRRT